MHISHYSALHAFSVLSFRNKAAPDPLWVAPLYLGWKVRCINLGACCEVFCGDKAHPSLIEECMLQQSSGWHVGL